MTIKWILLMGISTVFVGNAVQACPGVLVSPYISLKASYSKLDMDGTLSDAVTSYGTVNTDWVWGGSMAVGAKVYAFRTELEYNQSAKAKDTRHASGGLYDTIQGKQSYRSYMLNGYFDMPLELPVHPYVGVGVGVAQLKNSFTFLDVNSVTKQREYRLAYQLMAGVAYNFSDSLALDVGYRYVDKGNSKWSIADGAGRIKMESKEHQMIMGVRYAF